MTREQAIDFALAFLAAGCIGGVVWVWRYAS